MQRLYSDLLRPLFFLLDPETTHELVLEFLSQTGELFERDPIHDVDALGIEIAGIHFPNRVGLAAGMDKNAEAMLAWQGIGFGFIELGTITFHSQAGNSPPRLFRLPGQKSLLNRMGFNNPGAAAFLNPLQNIKLSQKLKIPIGLNFGKSRIVPSDLIDQVIEDYRKSLNLLQSFADYLVLNISSPNTPGLREWEKPERLSQLLNPIAEIAQKPLFLKISPELSLAEIDQVIELASQFKLAGLIATNTTISRDGVPDWALKEPGGISGVLLKKQARQVTEYIARHKPKKLALISVGGIDSPDEAKLRLELGADLVQLYTALVYEGPGLIVAINRSMA
ncbi:MAG: quinone-dependent dihydroorotate dehydrogenase [Candidatus Caenarcaniphilales bacterium]|nr:quinone-dependent dihydroorotate dehydrogenase [Candidatus Caenarcaniphilales bacterium]